MTEEETAETRAIEAEANQERMEDLNPKIESEKDRTDQKDEALIGRMPLMSEIWKYGHTSSECIQC
jgi:hypothetical protein